MNALSVLLPKKDTTGEALRASRRYEAGDTVFDFGDVEWRTRRDRETVEHPSGAHMFHPTLARVAHSCDPNCDFRSATRVLTATRSIAMGDLITYDYETTERWFSHPFWCRCGTKRCRGRIG